MTFVESSPHGKADVQSAQSQAEEQARVPRADEDAGGARDTEPSPQEGAQAPDRIGRREVSPAPVHPAGSGNRGFPRSRRITSGAEIRAIIGRGKRSRTAHLDVFVSASPVLHPRVGLIVPRHGQRIVDRNRLKRRLREILRIAVLPRADREPVAMDILLRARRDAYRATFAELKDELSGWMEREWPRGSSSC